MIAEVKHRERFPWELHPPGSAKRNGVPESFDEKDYRSRIQVATFDWSVYWGLIDRSKYDINRTINLWWNYTFLEPFPAEGGRLYDLYGMIRDRVVDISFKHSHVIPQESDYDFPHFLREKRLEGKLMKEISIVRQPISWEESMGKLLLKKSPPKTVVPEKSEKKKEKGGKKRAGRDCLIKLLLEGKRTDAELIEEVKSQTGYEYVAAKVRLTRERLNGGVYAPDGFAAPDKKVEEVGGTPTTVPTTGKSKKPPEAPPASSSTPLVKKLVLKKK